MKSINVLSLIMIFIAVVLFSCEEETIKPDSNVVLDKYKSELPVSCQVSGNSEAPRNTYGIYTYSTDITDVAYCGWSVVSGDISIISGQDTSTVYLKFGSNFSGGSIRGMAIGESGECAEVFNISRGYVDCTPPTSMYITQVKEYCPGNNFNFKASTNNGTTSGTYHWTVSNGATIFGGQGTSSLSVSTSSSTNGFFVTVSHFSNCSGTTTAVSATKYADFRADCPGGPFW